ncbi:hypothetical protein ACIQW9_00385 [Herminiimonas sp. NPDC097707]|uniref:hypothetical protein n=1 Tax=Herminiimonas sp. NPDC097707 TaxID=3364007 RepID=UPI00383A9AF2
MVKTMMSTWIQGRTGSAQIKRLGLRNIAGQFFDHSNAHASRRLIAIIHHEA